jgi:hypothetical protein
LRPFPKRLVMAALAVVGGYAAAALLAPKSPPVETPHSPAPLVAAAPVVPAIGVPHDGDELVDRVLGWLERRPNVAAKIRQSTRIDKDSLSGSGVYWQQGVENIRRTHMRLQTVVDDQPASYTQVNTGHELWTDRRVRDQRKVTRVDVGRVVRELNLADASSGRTRRAGGPSPAVLARGGLSQLVAELHRSFAFSAPRQVQYEGQAAVAVIGRWRPEELERVWPGLDPDNAGAWPGHLPHHVLLEVGASDLFPYLIEYRRGSQASLADAGGGYAMAADPLARFELYEVNFMATMPAGVFEFSATDIDWRDVTNRVIERLRSRPKVAGKPSVRRE